MKFEFDINKSESNKNKHGIDFVEAQALWNDSDLLDPVNLDEKYMKHGGKIWVKYRSLRIKKISKQNEYSYGVRSQISMDEFGCFYDMIIYSRN